MTKFPLVDSGLTVHVFNQGDDLIACLNKAMTFLTAQGSLQPTINLELPLIRETKPLFKMAGLQCNKFKGGKGKVILVLVIRVMLLLLGETTQAEWQGLLNESKEKENKYMENEIDLKNKTKELDNIVYKVGQSAQTVHMLTKPQVFYDNAHKQALGYQNPFYLKKVQRIKPTLYDGSVISSEHVVMLVIDDDETLILEEVKLSAEQAFWFHMSNPTTESSDTSPVKVDVPHELPKVSLVNESLKKLKFHLAKFDSVVKKRTTSDALTERKEIVDNATQSPNVTTIAPSMFKLDLDPLASRLLQNRKAHIDYLKYTQEQADILQGIVESSKTSNSNTPVLSSTGLKCSASNYGSKPTGIKKNDRILKPPSGNMKNKVEAQHRKVNKKNCVVEPICDADVKHSLLNANSELICVACNKCMFDAIHDMCLLDFVKNVNGRSKSAKKHTKQNIWKPMGHVFTEVGFKWKPTSRTFTIVGNSCPLTRITSANVVPPKTTTSHSVESQKPELKVYSRKLKNFKNVGSSKKAKIVESKNANHLEPNHTWGSNATDIPSSSSSVMTVRFGNDHIARIMGYGDYQLGNVTISRVYYVEGLGHNLFSVGSRDTNLYTISLDYMLKTSSIYLLSKASKTKSWLWYCRLSHLNFACALGKRKKSFHQPKAEDTNQEKLYLLHMDLCGPMHVASINGKRYILMIVDDYLRFTWVRFLRSKDEAPEAIIKCIKNIQVRLNATVPNVRTDNGTEFVNQTLREFYENLASRIKHLLPALLSKMAFSKGDTKLL
ncbi:retrovirus-related pol polyprotein from transposon TNT 1-94 [Tanacetum coccineum]